MLAPLVLALALLAPKPASLEDRRAELAKKVLAEAGRIEKEIERGDQRALLARVPAEGLRCGERVIPRSRVERDLSTEGSWLHGVLFGANGASAAAPDRPASLKAFFAKAKEIAAVVAFREDSKSELGLPCIEFRARDLLAPGAPFCLYEKGGRWWFLDSLYPC